MVEYCADRLPKIMKDITVQDVQLVINSLSDYSPFPNGTHAEVTEGKTAAAQRTIPLVKPLEHVLQNRHGLLLTKEDGEMMTMSSFTRKLESYINFLEVKLNGCPKRWYGQTREHKELLAKGDKLPEWCDVTIRCHDFRVDFCTRNYEAGIPIKALQKWMGHADAQMEVLLSRGNYAVF